MALPRRTARRHRARRRRSRRQAGPAAAEIKKDAAARRRCCAWRRTAGRGWWRPARRTVRAWSTASRRAPPAAAGGRRCAAATGCATAAWWGSRLGPAAGTSWPALHPGALRVFAARPLAGGWRCGPFLVCCACSTRPGGTRLTPPRYCGVTGHVTNAAGASVSSTPSPASASPSSFSPARPRPARRSAPGTCGTAGPGPMPPVGRWRAGSATQMCGTGGAAGALMCWCVADVLGGGGMKRGGG
jgi:hypothetical protein